MILLLSLLSTAHAGPTRAALKTSVTLPRTVIKPGDPVVIALRMENRTDEVLWFEQHTSGQCFLQKFAQIEASPALEAKPPAECSAPSAEVKPGESVGMEVDLRDAYIIPERSYSFNVKWRDGGPEVYGPLTQRVGPIRFATPFHEARMSKGDDFYLPSKTTAVWNGHESKPSTKKGEPPALILNFTVRIPGEGEAEKKVTLHLDKSRQFKLEGYTFEVVDYQFDQFMEIRIFENP